MRTNLKFTLQRGRHLLEQLWRAVPKPCNPMSCDWFRVKKGLRDAQKKWKLHCSFYNSTCSPALDESDPLILLIKWPRCAVTGCNQPEEISSSDCHLTCSLIKCRTLRRMTPSMTTGPMGSSTQQHRIEATRFCINIHSRNSFLHHFTCVSPLGRVCRANVWELKKWDESEIRRNC